MTFSSADQQWLNITLMLHILIFVIGLITQFFSKFTVPDPAHINAKDTMTKVEAQQQKSTQNNKS